MHTVEQLVILWPVPLPWHFSPMTPAHAVSRVPRKQKPEHEQIRQKNAKLPLSTWDLIRRLCDHFEGQWEVHRVTEAAVIVRAIHDLAKAEGLI